MMLQIQQKGGSDQWVEALNCRKSHRSGRRRNQCDQIVQNFATLAKFLDLWTILKLLGQFF